MYFSGRLENEGENFFTMFFMNGGHGARSGGDGPGCLSFPSNVSNQPVEAFEHQVPMLITEKSFVPDSGGGGRYRGGNAQCLRYRSRTGDKFFINKCRTQYLEISVIDNIHYAVAMT